MKRKKGTILDVERPTYIIHAPKSICSKVAWYTNLLLISAILINCAAFIGGSLKQNTCVRACADGRICACLSTLIVSHLVSPRSTPPTYNTLFLLSYLQQVPADRLQAPRLRARPGLHLHGYYALSIPIITPQPSSHTSLQST